MARHFSFDAFSHGKAAFFRRRGLDVLQLMIGLSFALLWIDGLILRGWMDLSSFPLVVRYLWWLMLVIAPLITLAALRVRLAPRPTPATRAYLIEGDREPEHTAETDGDGPA